MAQIGIMIEGQAGLTWEAWKRILQIAEDSGYQCVFRSDHFTNAGGPHTEALELWVSLTYAADHTERIEFGPLVTPITFRHPSMTVKYASAVDDLSGGRLVLGMGTGWQDREHQEYGIYFPELAERYERLTDGLEIVTRLFNNDEPVHYEGKHYSLDGAHLLPQPQRAGGPPILIGGNGPKKTLPLAAKYATEWNAVYASHALYKERTEQLNGYLEAEGRQPEDVKRSLMTRILYGKLQKRLDDMGEDRVKAMKERDIIIGTGSAVVEQIGKWTELGVERFMLQWLELDELDLLEDLANDVLPHFHQ